MSTAVARKLVANQQEHQISSPKKPKHNHFMMIPYALMESYKLSDAAMRTFLRFFKRYGVNGHFIGRYQDLSRILEIPYTSLKRVIPQLTEAGLLIKTDRGRYEFDLVVDMAQVWKKNTDNHQSRPTSNDTTSRSNYNTNEPDLARGRGQFGDNTGENPDFFCGENFTNMETFSPDWQSFHQIGENSCSKHAPIDSLIDYVIDSLKEEEEGESPTVVKKQQELLLLLLQSLQSFFISSQRGERSPQRQQPSNRQATPKRTVREEDDIDEVLETTPPPLEKLPHADCLLPLARELAAILRLPVTRQSLRIVDDYGPSALVEGLTTLPISNGYKQASRKDVLDLVMVAEECMEYIGSNRNKSRQQMSWGFFASDCQRKYNKHMAWQQQVVEESQQQQQGKDQQEMGKDPIQFPGVYQGGQSKSQQPRSGGKSYREKRAPELNASESLQVLLSGETTVSHMLEEGVDGLELGEFIEDEYLGLEEFIEDDEYVEALPILPPPPPSTPIPAQEHATEPQQEVVLPATGMSKTEAIDLAQRIVEQYPLIQVGYEELTHAPGQFVVGIETRLDHWHYFASWQEWQEPKISATWAIKRAKGYGRTLAQELGIPIVEDEEEEKKQKRRARQPIDRRSVEQRYGYPIGSIDESSAPPSPQGMSSLGASVTGYLNKRRGRGEKRTRT